VSASDQEAAAALRELSRLREQAEEARAVLALVLQDVIEAKESLGGVQASQLLEANEQLVMAVLRAQAEARAEAEAAALKLHDLAQRADLDILTDLPNRQLLVRRFAQAKAAVKDPQSRMALMFVDLDNFKRINDTLGHAIGDRVLTQVARRLSSSVGAGDTVSRYGGDEFLILLGDVSHAEVLHVAEKIIVALKAPCQIGQHRLSLTASIGISIYPEDGEDADTLIDQADAAMYRAKRFGLRGFAFHSEGPQNEQIQKLDLFASVTRPLERGHPSLDEEKERHSKLREANEQLIFAVLTAQKSKSDSEYAQRRQMEFLTIIAHELRNPLAPILSAAQLLGRISGDGLVLPEVQAIIERQVAHMSRLVSDLLDISRVNTGKMQLEYRRVDMAFIVEAAVDASRSAMETRRQRFRVQLPPHPLKVDGDPVRLTQILSNLLDNASKYTADEGEIGLVMREVEGTVQVTVSDNGIGITAEALPNVFEPFVRDIRAIKFNGVGWGVGLSVVRELVEAHGGHVDATSAGSLRGSQFIVTLPLRRLTD
jgi:diguanylate cyclase